MTPTTWIGIIAAVVLLNNIILGYLGEYKGVRESFGHKVQLGLLFMVVTALFIIKSTTEISAGLNLSGVLFGLSLGMMIVIVFVDYQSMIIPDTLNIGILAAVLVGKWLTLSDFSLATWKGSFYGFLIGGGLFLLIAVLSGGAMGGGDIKLMAVLGVWVGAIGTGLVILFSFVLGALISVGLLVLKIKDRKDMIPFGPFIVLAGMIVLFYKDEILHAYLMYVL